MRFIKKVEMIAAKNNALEVVHAALDLYSEHYSLDFEYTHEDKKLKVECESANRKKYGIPDTFYVTASEV